MTRWDKVKSNRKSHEMFELISPNGVVIMRHPSFDRVSEAAVKLTAIYNACSYTIRDTARIDIV